MGTRTVYQINDSDRKLIATLFSNSSHSTQFAETVLENLLTVPACSYGPNALLEQMLTVRYEKADGSHRDGDRIFWVVPAEHASTGDRESIVTVTHRASASGSLGQSASDRVAPWALARRSPQKNIAVLNQPTNRP